MDKPRFTSRGRLAATIHVIGDTPGSAHSGTQESPDEESGRADLET